MTDLSPTQPTWVVLTELAQLVAVQPGQQFTSRQVCEVFTDEHAATIRATEVGWTPDLDD